MIKITNIKWLSKEALEAKLTVSDGLFEIICFAHPFKGQINDEINCPINILNPEEIFKLDKQVYSLKLTDELGYKIEGKITDKIKGQMKVGNIILELDNPKFLPNDIFNDDFVSLSCDRLDVY